jgi:hypothetical protein
MRLSLGKATLAIALSIVTASAAAAQTSRLGVGSYSNAPAAPAPAPAAGGVGVGYMDLGPVLGLGGIGSASLAFGGRFETIFKSLPDMGNGLLGIEVGADWYSYSQFYGDFSFIAIGATANYHFNVDNKKIDPFIGLGLGDLVASAPSVCGGACNYNSGIYLIGRAGIRYFFSDNMAGYADVGSGYGVLHVGLTFKLRGAK